MSMFGRALGKGASAFVSGASKVGRAAMKGIKQDIPAGYKAAKAGVNKAMDTTPRKAGRTLKAAMKNVSRSPDKMKKLGKRIAKYGGAGAAGYGLAKMMNKNED